MSDQRQKRIAELAEKVDKSGYYKNPERVAKFALLMESVPIDRRGKFCVSSRCACTGCFNRYDKRFDGMVYEDYLIWSARGTEK